MKNQEEETMESKMETKDVFHMQSLRGENNLKASSMRVKRK